MFRVQIIVVDDGAPVVAGDRPEVVKVFEVGSTYRKQALAEKLALRLAERAHVVELMATGKGAKS